MGNSRHISDIIIEFKEKFSSEEVCRKMLHQLRWPNGFHCPQCGEENYYWIETRHLYECRDCRAQTSLTSGTIMHNTKLPLQYWFLVIHLASEGIIFSARWLSITLQINYRSAHRMLHAVRRVMRSQNGFHLFSKFIKSAHSCPTSESAARPQTADDDSLKRVKRMMKKRINQFIRTIYRSVQDHYKQRYIDEFYFQWQHRIGSRKHIFHSLIGACTVLYYPT